MLIKPQTWGISAERTRAIKGLQSLSMKSSNSEGKKKKKKHNLQTKEWVEEVGECVGATSHRASEEKPHFLVLSALKIKRFGWAGEASARPGGAGPARPKNGGKKWRKSEGKVRKK